jgi:hypothetical protein
MTSSNNQTWLKQEAQNIQNNAQVSMEEAQQILKQRIMDYATNNNITEEEAIVHYSKLRKNTKSKTV